MPERVRTQRLSQDLHRVISQDLHRVITYISSSNYIHLHQVIATYTSSNLIVHIMLSIELSL